MQSSINFLSSINFHKQKLVGKQVHNEGPVSMVLQLHLLCFWPPPSVIVSMRDLGVVLDSWLTLSPHVTVPLCRTGCYQVRQLWPIVLSMTAEAARTAAAAFISCRLDYCNSLLYGLPDTLLHKLQSVHRMPLHDWSLATTSWSHHAGTTQTPLATHARASRVQSGLSGSPVTVQAGTCLLGRGLLPRVQQHLGPSAVS